MSLFHAALQPALDANGVTISGATWQFSLTGTTTPTNVYANNSLVTSLGSTVTADAAGRFATIFLNDAINYRAILKDSGGTTIKDIDPAGNLSGQLDDLSDDIAALDARIDALEAAAGDLSTVTRTAAAGSFDLEAGFNDQLGNTRVVTDGVNWNFESSRWSALDFTPATTYYLDYATGDNADTGLTAALAFKTFDYATSVIDGLAAGSKVELRIVGDVGTLSGFDFDTPDFDGQKVRIVGGYGGTAPTRFVNMREDKDMATFAWVAHGSSGAWKSNVAGAVGNWVAQFYLGAMDANGIPQPIVSTGQNATTVQDNELTSYWDATYLYVHLPNGEKPNPFVNWLYSNNSGQRQFRSDSGTLLFDNCDFFGGGTGGGFNSIRARSVADLDTTSQLRLGFRDCRFYGASANAMGTYDIAVVVTENCAGGYCFNDLFNIHSFNLSAGDGALITYYEDNARGSNAGYTGFNFGVTPSSSDNGSTVHDGASVVRVGSRFADIKDCSFVDVGGADSLNYGIRAPINLTGDTSYYPSSICYEANTGAGTNRRMVLVGCAADWDADVAAIEIAGSATDAKVLVDRWQGDSAATLLRSGSGTIRRLSDNGQIYP